MSARKIWLLKLVLPGRFGKAVTGMLLLCLLLPLFYLGSIDYGSEPTPYLFFSLVIAYIIPVFSHITARATEAFEQLRPLLTLDAESFQRQLHRLSAPPARLVVIDLCVGTVAGFVHMSFVSGSVSAALHRLVPGAPGFASMVGTLLVWIVMTTVVSMLVQQALVFSRAGREHLRFSLLNCHGLLAFGRVSSSASLALLGALALFPLIGLEGGMDMKEILPGAVALSVPLIVLFIMPVWPVHHRLAAMKSEQLDAANNRIGAYLAQEHDATGRREFDPAFTALLVYRREIAETATWPFDVSNASRLAFYLFIPPLTWVAAALMENLVDSVL